MIREKIWEILAKAKTLYQKKKCWLNVDHTDRIEGSGGRIGIFDRMAKYGAETKGNKFWRQIRIVRKPLKTSVCSI